MSLQADGKVAFEEIPMFGVFRRACHDSSLYLLVLVLFLEAAVLSQVHVTLEIFYQHIVHVYWLVSTTITFVFISPPLVRILAEKANAVPTLDSETHPCLQPGDW